MVYKVYYKHWKTGELRCYKEEEASNHVEAIGNVIKEVQEGGDYRSKPFLAILQGGKA